MKNIILVDKIIKDVIFFSNGALTSNEIDSLHSIIENEISIFQYNDHSVNNFLRIINSLFDKVLFFRSSIKFPHYITETLKIAANSNYLTDVIVSNPEYLYLVFESNFITTKFLNNELAKELNNMLSNYKNFPAKLNVIRNFKRKYLLKIGFNDIVNNCSLKETTSNLSQLAISISRVLFALCIEIILNKYEIKKLSRKYAIISLGKLGGHELNYSSDIDLMLFYDKNGIISKQKKIDTNSFFNEVILLFIKYTTEITERGYIYRVDFRLRPGGKNSLLSNSLNYYLNYYETKGEDWERQMLLKTDFVCGSKSLYTEFYNFLKSYIFAKSLFESPITQIRSMKSKIELGKENDIKLCKGGIRDIEFSIQALQLINGSKNKLLFNGNTLEVLDLLSKNNIISSSESINLQNAYILFRKIEHYLQLMNDRQTHQIPEDNSLLLSMAIYLGYGSIEEFNSDLIKNKSLVRDFFDSVFYENEESCSSMLSFSFDNINFTDKNRAKKNFEFIKSGTDLFNSKGFDSKTIELFKNFEKEIILHLSNSQFPDYILENFTKGIHSVFFPSLWYSNFLDNMFLSKFITLCAFSNRAFDLWQTEKRLGDYILSGRVFVNNFVLNNLGLNTNSLLFIVSLQYSLKIISAVEFGQLLSKIIFNKIVQVYNELNIKSFTVLGFGSFGTSSMNFASDIDLIFLKSKIELSNVEKDAEIFISELSKKLKPFKFDFRLRPEGKSSQIVWGIESFKIYLNKRARVWELQAFQKAKFIAGEPAIYNELISEYFNVIKFIDHNTLVSEITEMRKKIVRNNLNITQNIKYSEGAINDIDLIIQRLFFLDNNAKDLFEKDFIYKLEYLAEKYEIADFNLLKRNYEFLKTLEISLQNIFSVNNSNIPMDKTKLHHLSEFMQFPSVENLTKKINDVLLQNQKLYFKYLGH